MTTSVHLPVRAEKSTTAEPLERRHPDYSVRGLNPERLAAIRRYAGPEVLDVGCGNGVYVLHLADEYCIRGVDYERFDAWVQRPELFSLADAQDLRMPADSVDTIVSFETLEHLPNPRRALEEYHRVCRRNVILTVPNCAVSPGMRRSNVIFGHWIDRTHVNFWDLDAFARVVGDAGFRVTTRDYINRISLGPLVMEALGLGDGLVARAGAKVFRLLQRREYPLTSLVVAEKR